MAGQKTPEQGDGTRPQQPERFPVEKLGGPMGESGAQATNYDERMAAIVSGLAGRDIVLPDYASRFGISLHGVDAPTDRPMKLSALYAGVNTHEDEQRTYYTVCVGLGRYEGDPRPEHVITRSLDAVDASGGISRGMSGIYSYWENHDIPEPDFPTAVYAEGYSQISAWAKYHLAVPKDGGKPYLIINPLQYSSLTDKAQREFTDELEATVSEGETSNERRKAAWRLKHISSPYQYSDRDTALGIVGLAVAQQLGVDVVCTPYGKVNETLRQNNRGIRVVDGFVPP